MVPLGYAIANATCFMPGNPFGLRHLLYAGEPVHRSGLPSTAVAPQPTTITNLKVVLV
ncbi:MAG: hypothetical protein QNJ51_25135 [Calothrix sp. MO_167.B12]|nr:hypothetical protein [Calothrix sp. MO_167.B12]